MTETKIKYSIDKVNLHANVRYEDFKSFIEMYLDVFKFGMTCYKYNISSIDYKENTNFKLYRYTWRIELQEGSSIWLGYRHNSEGYSSANVYGLKLEFNPNKNSVKSDCILGMILSRFFIGSHTNTYDVKVKSLDVAIDIPRKHSEILYDVGLKRDINYYCGTAYMGKGDGRVKVYDKTVESSLDYDLTRYEISLVVDKLLSSVNDYYFDCDGMPRIYFLDSIDLSIDALDKAVLYGLQMYPGLLNEFSRRKKEKYREVLNSLDSFQPSPKSIVNCIRQYFDNLNVLYRDNIINNHKCKEL